MTDRVLCTVIDGVADVRLNRPDKLNALDADLFAALAETGEALHGVGGLRAVVLCGEGRSFCAGLDMASFGAMADGRPLPFSGGSEDDGAPSRGQRAVLAFHTLPVPVIAAIRGHAPDAVFGVLEVRWGLAPDMVGTQLLPRLVGPAVAADLILTGRTVDAEEAVAIGLVNRIADDPLTAAHELAAVIAGRSPDAVRVAKGLLAVAQTGTFAEGLAAGRASLRALMGSPDQREAAAAGLAKRAPVFVDP